MLEDPTIHLLVRFSDKVGAVDDTIEAHRQILRKHGAVWFGKMGKTLAHARIHRLREQIAEAQATYLFLVQKTVGRYKVYRGTVAAVKRDRPIVESQMIPLYYKSNELQRFMTLWLRLTTLEDFPPEKLRELRLVNTGNRVSEALHTSMAGMFVVCSDY